MDEDPPSTEGPRLTMTLAQRRILAVGFVLVGLVLLGSALVASDLDRGVHHRVAALASFTAAGYVWVSLCAISDTVWRLSKGLRRVHKRNDTLRRRSGCGAQALWAMRWWWWKGGSLRRRPLGAATLPPCRPAPRPGTRPLGHGKATVVARGSDASHYLDLAHTRSQATQIDRQSRAPWVSSTGTLVASERLRTSPRL